MINPFNPGFGNISPSCIKRPVLQQKLLDQADQLHGAFCQFLLTGHGDAAKPSF